jgi:hypothetical protein
MPTLRQRIPALRGLAIGSRCRRRNAGGAKPARGMASRVLGDVTRRALLRHQADELYFLTEAVLAESAFISGLKISEGRLRGDIPVGL